MASRPYRALLLPVLAVLLPSVLIVVLASRWLALERETARLRSTEAAAAALNDLRGDLFTALETEARAIAADVLRPLAPSRGALAGTVFVFDAAGNLVGPRELMPRPSGPTGSVEQAARILAAGVASSENGNVADALRASAEVLRCCAGTRDEFGVSYALYALWQRAAMSKRAPGFPRQTIVRDLRDVIDLGWLDRPSDVSGVRDLAELLNGVPGAGSLSNIVEDFVLREERRRRLVSAAADVLASIAVGAGEQRVVIVPWRESATPFAAIVHAAESPGVVLVPDRERLAQWIAAWGGRSAFAFRVVTEPVVGTAGIQTPLFAGTPTLTVAARLSSADAQRDSQREGLFLAAIAAVIALTLVAGFLATRDVRREHRLAAVRSTFLAGATHEIKTPITSIRLMAETLKQRRATPEATDELLGTIVDESEHLTNLVDNLLTTSRIENGTRTYRPSPISFDGVVKSACERFEYMLRKEGFFLNESMTGTPLRVCADPEALQQAVLNLLSNAMKYSGQSRTIRLSIEARGDRAEVSVADAGIGVRRDDQQRIFSGFYRTRESADTTGTGLGLVLVRHFAESHGGEVRVRSEVGAGSEFVISLPRLLEPVVETAAAVEAASHDSPSPTHG